MWLFLLLPYFAAPASQPASKPASQPAPVPPVPKKTVDEEMLDDLDFIEFLQMEDEAPWFIE